MDIAKLKDKLGDETFASLQAYLDEQTARIERAETKARKAEKESIEGRKSKDARIAALSERLGVDIDADLEALPDVKGAADAAKQNEAKFKRLERELADALQAKTETEGKFRGSLQKAAIAEALGGHEFVARDLVETFVSQRLTWEGDDLLFKSDDGKLIPVKDGVAGIAKTRPELLKPTGTGGAGVRQSNAGSGGTGGNQQGSFGGDRKERTAAIAAKFPDLQA